MRRRYYFPKDLGAMLPFYQNLCAKAPQYVAQLGITPADLSFLNLMSALWASLTDFQNRAKRFAEDWTSLRDACFDGAPGSTPPAWPVWTGPAMPPVAMDTGCETRLRAMIRLWKTSPGYTEPVGRDLGIVGAEVEVNAAAAQPELRVKMIAGHPQINVSPGPFDAVEIEVDRGDGFALFNVSTGAPLKDSHPLPAPGQTDVWSYRAILRENNQRVGQWSLSVPVPVMGI